MKFIYVSSLCSQKLFNYLFESSSTKPGMAAQKFNRLLVEGLSFYEKESKVETLSEIPVPTRGSKKLFWNIASEREGKIKYNYIPTINLPILKSILVLINSFFQLIFIIVSAKQNDKIILCDIISVPLSLSVFLVSKLLKVKAVAIVTDLPSIDYAKKQRIYMHLSNLIIQKFDAYVLLTEQMNKVVNLCNKPYMVMEGLVDISMKHSSEITKKNISAERILLYAGGLSRLNGLNKLIDSFMLLNDENLRFHIFGTGEMEKEMRHYMDLDSRIVYKGNFPNKVIVEKEWEATLLVNPRPTYEEFSKYSFPSKNMEYMVSGTPLVTTPLPGMPIEYYDYVYLFEDETVPGLAKTLRSIFSLDEEILFEMGKKAKEFVLEEKNNHVQAKRVVDLCKTLV